MLPYALLIGKVKREPNHSNLTVTKIFKDKWQAVSQLLKSYFILAQESIACAGVPVAVMVHCVHGERLERH